MKANDVTLEYVAAKCVHDNGCIVWTGYKTKAGYGCIFRGNGASRKWIYVHRFSYEQAHGAIPPGMNICHTCDNPACCNPAHLFAGTDKDNSDDKINKGRQARGSLHGMAKLTEAVVLEIRTLAAESVPLKEIARRLGVNYDTTHSIARGDSWKHVRRTD